MFICGRWVNSRAPSWSLGSFGVVEFSQARPGCRSAHLGSLVSLARALGVVDFILGLWFHIRALWRTLGSSVVLGFTHVLPRVHWVHQGSLESLAHALVVD